MSYDIHLVADLGGPELFDLDFSWNYTSNCAPMWRAAGADLAAFDGRPARECILPLQMAIGNLRNSPGAYKQYEPANGWGTVQGLTTALGELLATFLCAPAAIVKVSR